MTKRLDPPHQNTAVEHDEWDRILERVTELGAQEFANEKARAAALRKANKVGKELSATDPEYMFEQVAEAYRRTFHKAYRKAYRDYKEYCAEMDLTD